VPVESTYDYAIIRVVPRVERGEVVNVGIILSCPAQDFLAARIELDPARIQAIDAAFDLDAARRHLDTIPLICAGSPQAGPLGQLPQRSRFHWLVAPRSTIIQTSPVHTGRTINSAVTLERLVSALVRTNGQAPG
jgi:Protein of unknown function (DUF3037)